MLDAAPDARFPRRLYHPHTSLPLLPHLKTFLPLASVMCRRLWLLWRQEAGCCRLCFLALVTRACRLCFLLPLLLVACLDLLGAHPSRKSLLASVIRTCLLSLPLVACFRVVFFSACEFRVSQLACCTCVRVLTKDCLQIVVDVARAGVPEKLAEMDIVVDVGAVRTHTHTHTHTYSIMCVCVWYKARERALDFAC